MARLDVDRPPRRVRWEMLTFKTVSAGTRLGGPVVTYWDGMSFEADPDRGVWNLARNQSHIVVTPSPSPDAPPFFIASPRTSAAIPIEGAADAFGMLRLGKRTGRREFRARLEFPSPAPSIRPGMGLRRTTRWAVGDSSREESRLIATVVG